MRPVPSSLFQLIVNKEHYRLAEFCAAPAAPASITRIDTVKFSLDRLPSETCRLRPLGVCQSSISLIAMKLMLQIEANEQVYEFARQLIGVGLAEPEELGYCASTRRSPLPS